MKAILTFAITLLLAMPCYAQESQPLVGGRCEGCEAIFEYGDRVLTPADTLPLFNKTAPKLKLTGTVFQRDGKTPAADVILYIYHTNRGGVYQKAGDETGWATRHGFIRGWVKTDSTGRYTFYTFRPGSYPNRRAPEHIHLTVKEPGTNEYYMEDFLFDDDPLLTTAERARLRGRGGSGIVTPVQSGEIFVVKRDIILGLNIPNYDRE